MTIEYEPTELDKTYDPHLVEDRWYQFWETEGFFAGRTDTDQPPYSMVIPPPNVTGSLHMGHALNNTLQDILARYRRLKGDNVLWMPGTDHAASPPRMLSNANSMKKASTAIAWGGNNSLNGSGAGREESGRTILHQLRRLGASCDWDRERFTMTKVYHRQSGKYLSPSMKKTDLPGGLHHQLVPTLPYRSFRSGSGIRRA